MQGLPMNSLRWHTVLEFDRNICGFSLMKEILFQVLSKNIFYLTSYHHMLARVQVLVQKE